MQTSDENDKETKRGDELSVINDRLSQPCYPVAHDVSNTVTQLLLQNIEVCFTKTAVLEEE